MPSIKAEAAKARKGYKKVCSIARGAQMIIRAFKRPLGHPPSARPTIQETIAAANAM